MNIAGLFSDLLQYNYRMRKGVGYYDEEQGGKDFKDDSQTTDMAR